MDWCLEIAGAAGNFRDLDYGGDHAVASAQGLFVLWIEIDRLLPKQDVDMSAVLRKRQVLPQKAELRPDV